MNTRKLVRAFAILWLAAASATTLAQTRSATRPAPLATAPAVGERASVTSHQLKLPDRTLDYRATAATVSMKDEAGKAKADIFYIAYELNRPAGADPADRPITFVFNGGPGAAAVWLHLGALGPQRIALDENGLPPAPPYRLIDNPQGWLDLTDLVFIDPVGTGYSRPAPGEKAEQFYGVEEDVRWVGEFVRLYLTRAQRWASPKFLAGESYGTTRAAALAEYLLERHGIALNGVILISTVLDFRTIGFGQANDLAHALYLPTYAATALYHKKLAADLQADPARTIQDARRFALEEYLPALARGDALPADQRAAVARRLSGYTGLPADLIERADLRIDAGSFQNRLLEADRKLVGRFDARVTADDPDPLSPWRGFDPSLAWYLPVYSGTFNHYVRQSLGYESDLPYEVLSDKVHPWNFGQQGAGGLNVAGRLRDAMRKSPHMKVLFASGYYDLATPFFASDYTIDHLDLPKDLRSNISHKYYEGGHMMYHHLPSLDKLKADVAEFYQAATRQGAARR